MVVFVSGLDCNRALDLIT